ncbi:MAG: VWA domain-containing protein [Spirochaetaceae bacterium]|jgi:magnesium chelatase subunit D|nr:VWA domain-containing protein [Spirochaetaceae bacterium]
MKPRFKKPMKGIFSLVAGLFGGVMPVFPFFAVMGQDAMRKALILNAVNPRIGGLLLDGEKGTAKSTAVRAFGEALNAPVVELPLNAGEDRVVGALDIEQTLLVGKPVFSGGLLGKANGAILYVDEVNLLPDHIIDILLDVHANKINRIEREGISHQEYSNFVLIGTMNSEEGELRPAFLDRFGLFVRVIGIKDADLRVEIVKNCLKYEKCPQKFIEKYEYANKKFRERIKKSREMLPHIELCDENRRKIANICLEANVDGHRADIVIRETSRALAAWNGRAEVSGSDIDEAAVFALPHRLKQPRQNRQETEEPQHNRDGEKGAEPPRSRHDAGETPEHGERQTEADGTGEHKGIHEDGAEHRTKNAAPSKPKTTIFDAEKEFKVRHLVHSADRKRREGRGRRTRVNSALKAGRYVHATSERKNDDLAFDATIRAASPFQKTRKKLGLAIVIHRDDIREKTRQKKIAGLIVFVVDASGSMAAGARMTETKTAVLSLLKDAYIKRDKVALVAFRGEAARVLLPPTGSVQRGYKLLRDMETGGRTPLNDGLMRAYAVIKNETRKTPGIMPTLIVITDGKGNVPLSAGRKPKQELMEIGGMIAKNHAIDSLVIDIEKDGLMKFGIAGELSGALRGRYFKADELRCETILEAMRV